MLTGLLNVNYIALSFGESPFPYSLCRARPTGVQWRPLWDSMAQECREELTLVEADTLLDTLEAYLQKHR